MRKTFLVIISLIIIFPMFIVLLLSMFSYYRFPLIFPQNFTSEFWKSVVFENPLLVSSLANSVVLAICNGICSTVVGIMTARALVRHAFIGKKAVKAFFTLPLFIPAMALFLGIHSVMIRLHLMNRCSGIILAHMLISIPYAINIFISFFQGINQDMEDVGKTLGCTPISLFIRIVLPLIMPGIYLSFSISFLISFTEYFSTFLIGGGKVITFVTMMYPYIHNGDLGHGAVLGLIFIGINVCIFYLAEHLSKRKLKIENYLFE
ncbi:putative spermidine/putrescine transport system permease protein [Anaerosolibacter carboniphilus]|uniref:Putative spermidine/putrescine transport system permease protein n=1 Tax=Anaerosolibacter carboniphilus TaxID=1417629 RepID=A0A841KU16_9FIRM|nr:ABC transporter permease subunit [Anaerosolibacter carboniphilus]MBB6215520.1 putative spermidine/putrescine transport system permease protein [Anaerosolibacter carboniphilus]